MLVALLMLLQGVLHFKLLPTSAAGKRLLMNLHVGLQLFCATKIFIAFRTSPAAFLCMVLKVFVEIFWKVKDFLAVRACVMIRIGGFAVRHDVSL